MHSLKYYIGGFGLIAGGRMCVIAFAFLAPPRTVSNPSSLSKAVTIELQSWGQVNLVQAKAKVTYSQREFNKLHQGLKLCFEGRNICTLTTSDTAGCTYTAKIINVRLCLNHQQQVQNATAAAVVLHREDLLRIFEL